jgi:glyoxylase-like metal-dependent hydrolase (beta-lactamase superfamily II)
MMASESLYLVEGNEKAVLIDAGTRITDLDKIVASLTKKPVMLVVTHAHPDHTGSAINYFPELYIGAGDAASQFVSTYKGKIRELKDGDVIDLGGRALDVVATPGHTPGSTTFIDRTAGYGFSGDSFGSGNLLLGGSSTLLATCQKTSALMAAHGIKSLYPGHFFGKNAETKQRLDDMATISRDVLAGKVKGEPNPRGMMGLNLIQYYGADQLKVEQRHSLVDRSALTVHRVRSTTIRLRARRHRSLREPDGFEDPSPAVPDAQPGRARGPIAVLHFRA